MLLPHARGLRFESLRGVSFKVGICEFCLIDRWESVGFCLIDASIRGWQRLPSGYVLWNRITIYYSRLSRTTFWALVEELGVYVVALDRPGYGESDPDPKQTVKSLAYDIEELADQLNLGPKFYITGFSMGGMVTWSCHKYIPHRLAGATLISPGINYWWPNLPSNLSNEAFSRQLKQDQWAYRVAQYVPWLSYWWYTHKWFSSFSIIESSLAILPAPDLQVLSKLIANFDPSKV
ncbi:alpha/beta hydrolase fold protein [Tanacetum coccineum]